MPAMIFCGAVCERAFAQQPLDPSFGNNGIAVLDSVDAFYGVDIALQEDGKILALFNGNCGHGFLTRMMPDGSLDQSFVTDQMYRSWPVFHPGVIEMQGSACNANMSAVRRLSTQKILLAIGPEAILQFNDDGTIDSSFGNNTGYSSIVSYVNTNPLAPKNIRDLKEVTGTGVLFASSIFPPPMQDSLVLSMMLYNGSMHTAFGTGGYIKVALPAAAVGTNNLISDIQILPNNRVLVAGSGIFSGSSTMRDVFLAMYTTSGQLVNSFGNNGVKLMHVNSDYDEAWELAYRDDNNIYLIGSTYHATNYTGTRFVCKFNATGTIDNSFGTNGFVHWSHLSHNANTAFLGMVTPNNFVYTAADTGTGMHYNYLSYNASGTANTQFATNGWYATGNYDKISKMIAQPDNKVLLLGSNGLHPRLMRFQASINTSLGNELPQQEEVKLWSAGSTVYCKLLKEEEGSKLQLNLYGIDGKLLQSYNSGDCNSNGSGIYQLSLPQHLPAGVYVVSMVCGNLQKTISVVL